MTGSDHTTAQRKTELRALAKERRAEAARNRHAAGEAAAVFFAALAPSQHVVVAGYWPLLTELDCRPLLAACIEADIPCVLPVIDVPTGLLRFRRWQPDVVLAPGPFGVWQPGVAAPELTPAVVVVPLLAFDRTGTRLGYGAGFYDRTIARLRGEAAVVAVGLGFAEQEMVDLPCAAHDVPLDWIVTPREAIKTTGR